MVLNTKTKRSPPVHHRKRVGQHHKQTKRYVKTYWPYLPLIVVVVLGITLNSFWSSGQRNVLGYATDMSTGGLLQSTNSQRISNSLGALALNGELSSAAQAKANDMASRNYWSHNTPDGATPWTFIIQAGYNYQAAGENLAYGFSSSNDTINAWMNSPEHRANVLNGNYADVGFGVANAANFQGTGPETIVVAMYGKPVAVVAAPTPAPSTPAPTTKVTPTPAAPAAAAPTTQNTPTPSPSDQAKPDESKPKPASPAHNASGPNTTAGTETPKTQSMTRIQLISQGSAPWSAFAVSSLAVVCIMAFLLRHGLAWRRVLVKSEEFIIRRHMLDIILVSIGVLGFILTRSVGTIH